MLLNFTVVSRLGDWGLGIGDWEEQGVSFFFTPNFPITLVMS